MLPSHALLSAPITTTVHTPLRCVLLCVRSTHRFARSPPPGAISSGPLTTHHQSSPRAATHFFIALLVTLHNPLCVMPMPLLTLVFCLPLPPLNPNKQTLPHFHVCQPPHPSPPPCVPTLSSTRPHPPPPALPCASSVSPKRPRLHNPNPALAPPHTWLPTRTKATRLAAAFSPILNAQCAPAPPACLLRHCALKAHHAFFRQLHQCATLVHATLHNTHWL